MKFLLQFTLVLNLIIFLTCCIDLNKSNKINLFEPEVVKQFQPKPFIVQGFISNIETMTNNFQVVPIIKEINCTGLTLRQLSKKIEETYGINYTNLNLTIKINENNSSPWGTIGIYGCVGREGRINLSPSKKPFTLTQAFLQVGGLTPQANRKIQITRTANPEDLPQLTEPVTQTMEFNYDAILSGKIPDPPLVRDDVVRVLEK